MNKKAVIGVIILVAVFAAVGMLEGEPADDAEFAPFLAADDEATEASDEAAEADEPPDEGEGDEAADELPPGGKAKVAAGTAGGLQAVAAEGREPRRTSSLRFVRWQQEQGLFSADVPAGWRIEGRIDPQGLDKGAFLIQGYAPDGRAMFSFSHNWQWFMEYQYGPYRPGTATLESLVVPNIPANLPAMALTGIRVTYRSPNKPFELRNPATGLPLRSDQGTLGLLAVNRRGEVFAGTLMGETLYMPVPGTPGLWGLRIFSGGLAPASSAAQADIQAIQARVASSLELAPEFSRAWSEAHQHTVQRMREYSRQMDRVFERYLASTRRSNSREGKDPMEGWAEMMREGHYERDERTDEEHWVGNNNRYWWKDDHGTLYGNNTGQPPADHGNWHALTR